MSFPYDYNQDAQQSAQPSQNDVSGVNTNVTVNDVTGTNVAAPVTVSPIQQDQQLQQQQSPPGSVVMSSTSPVIVSGIPSGNGDSKSTLWMGELEPWYDENAIRKIWQTFGESVTVKLIRDKFSGVNAGYCFVDFGSPSSAAKALTLNGQPIPNSQRIFRLNWASGGGLIDKRDDRGPEFSIFVGDLSPEVTEFNLLQLFQSRYSSCKSAKIMTDPNTNASRGYGFVRFSDDTQMQRALAEMQGFFLGNRPIRISTATPKSKPGQNGVGIGQGINQAALGGGPGSNGPQGNIYQMGLGGPAGYYGTPQTLNQFTDPNNTTVFVGGLSGHVSEDELRRYFSGFGDITYVRIPPGKGCGFVQFVQRHSAEAAITQMQGYPIGNSRVRLSWGRSQNVTGGVGGPGPSTGIHGVGVGGAYRPAPPPPNVYPQLNLSAQPPHYGPYGPINPHVQGQVQPILNGGQPQQVGGLIQGQPQQQQQQQSQQHFQQPQQPVSTNGDTLLPLGQDPSEPIPVARLNELYLAAKDGRLDRMEADGRGYHGVYA